MSAQQAHSDGAPVGGVHAETKLRDTGFVMNGHHCHGCYELFYVDSGSCRFIVDDSIYDLGAGDFILIPPMGLHYTSYPFGACRRSVILFGRDDVDDTTLQYLPPAERFFGETHIFHVPDAHREQIHACISRMTAEDRICDTRSPQLIKIRLQELFLLCGRCCSFLSDPPQNIHTNDVQILEAARYICENYMNAITTQDVASAVGFSPNYLSRRFRQAAGIGLHEYLVFVRLHHAALELVSTDDTITDIACRCGFSDSNYFKDAFKKKYGITPRSYRKAM